jgi:ABC-type sugar transport system ATPase subunit
MHIISVIVLFAFMLKVENLYKSYPPKGEIGISGCGTKFIEKSTGNEQPITDFAVNNISFTLKKNEILAILGENGSGKSTLLKMIAGLLEADSGKIILNNVLIGGPSTKLVAGHENIRLIHQNYNLFPNISLADNILYAMRFFTKEYQEQKLEELLDICNLESISHKFPRETSGGEQQRTAIAAALATNIDLLLLDEPFSNLDVFNKTELKEYIRKISKRMGVSIVFVTHDAHDALSVSTRTAVIRKGQFLQMDEPKQIYTHPNSNYVANISGSFNLLKINSLKEIIAIESKKSYGIHPEDLSIGNEADHDLSGALKSCVFYGAYYSLTVEVSKGYLIRLMSPEFIETDGQVIYLKLRKEKIISFFKSID